MNHIYDLMISAVREHWKAHDNAYPQRFELTASALDALVAHRTLVNKTMNFSLSSDFDKEFLGVPVVVSEAGNVMVAADGSRVPLGA